MASNPYSVRFLLEATPAAGNYTFTVPDNMVAIVRDLDANLPATAGAGAVGLAIAGAYFAASPAAGGTQSTWEWRGRQVANAGEHITIGVAAGVLGFSLSGYLLAAT